jgi:hypothetical protein
VSPCLITPHAMSTDDELAVQLCHCGGEWSASRPGRFISLRRSPRYSLDRRVCGPRSRSGCCGKKIRRESNADSSVVPPSRHTKRYDPPSVYIKSTVSLPNPKLNIDFMWAQCCCLAFQKTMTSSKAGCSWAFVCTNRRAFTWR